MKQHYASLGLPTKNRAMNSKLINTFSTGERLTYSDAVTPFTNVVAKGHNTTELGI